MPSELGDQNSPNDWRSCWGKHHDSGDHPCHVHPIGRGIGPVQHGRADRTIIPPPAPCRNRATVSSTRLPDAAHRPEATVNNATAPRNVRLVPNRSPIHPDAGMNTAKLNEPASVAADRC